MCEFDELSVDNEFNQILKATSMLLIRHGSVSGSHRAALKRAMLFFADVTDIEPGATRWSALRFTRNTRSYQVLPSVCQLVIEGLLMTTQSGDHKLRSFVDDQAMSRLYEKFVLEYFVKHWPELWPRASRIAWDLGAGETTMLPLMQSDIMLSKDHNVLIIDAKYYSRNTQERFDVHTVHSANLYQIFAYVTNKKAEEPAKSVAGMLLYAKTDQAIQPDAHWLIGGNEFKAQTLDLGLDFKEIAQQLDDIALRHFGVASSQEV